VETREMVPTIRGLRDHAERYRRHEIDKARRMLAKGDDPHEVIEAMSQALINKLLHHPTAAIHHASDEERDEIVKLLHRLYDIKPE
jgi:glutamyl-tRNA reductase